MSHEDLRPTTTNDREGWAAYWRSQGEPWRTEPDIGDKRKQFLTQHLAVKSNIRESVYPFKDVSLNRADVEWLLATHESAGIRGPVYSDDPNQRNRTGLDVRGADLSGADLRGLPLARLRGGLSGQEWDHATVTQRLAAKVCLNGSNLSYSHLEGSALTYALMQGAVMVSTHLEGADLYGAHLDAEWPMNLRAAFLDRETILRDIIFTNKKGVSPRMLNIHWGEAAATSIGWSAVRMVGEERVARQRRHPHKAMKTQQVRLGQYISAVNCYRQLATVLHRQGLNEDADRFAYRAQLMQRVVQRRQHHYLRYIGSLLLDLLAGYGYRPGRAILLYLAVILWFANFYVWASHGMITLGLPPSQVQPLAWYEALILSVSSFHGRGFQPFQNLNDPVAALAGMQAVLGLVIEVSFIATFTQRFFGK